MNVLGVTITHADRLMFADSTVSKGELASYYANVAPQMLPHVACRPLSVLRCPAGADGACFYQKHWTGALPDGVGTIDIVEADGQVAPYLYVRSAKGLVSLVQFGVVEFHCWASRIDLPDSPDRVVFDLDPSPDVAWSRVVQTANRLRMLLLSYELQSWVKTTGGKGLHVVVPIARRATWEQVSRFSRLITSQLVHTNPTGLVDVAAKAARTGRIFIDYLRNVRGATAVAAWSTRARSDAPVAVPRSWRSARAMRHPEPFSLALAMTTANRQRVDPWAGMLTCKQRLSQHIIDTLESLEKSQRT